MTRLTRQRNKVRHVHIHRESFDEATYDDLVTIVKVNIFFQVVTRSLESGRPAC